MQPHAPSLRPPSLIPRLIIFVALSIFLMVSDQEGHRLQRIRSALAVATQPLITLATLPAKISHGVSDFFTTTESLQKRYDVLHAQQQQLQMRLQQLDALEAENRRLRKLLGAATRVADRAVVAGLVEVSQESSTRTIVIDKGTGDSVYVGQPVLDAYGVIGQVTDTNAMNSRVTLITDPGHAIPAQVVRTGLRVIVFGLGVDDNLEIRFLTPTTDIKEGDLIISSGMGGRFPPRYPVARVTRIAKDPNEAYLEVIASPIAHVNNSREVLLVWPGKRDRELPENAQPAPSLPQVDP